MSQQIIDDDWNIIVEKLGGARELDHSAKETGALLRMRKVKDGQSLLRLCLAYGYLTPLQRSCQNVTAITAVRFGMGLRRPFTKLYPRVMS